MQGAGGNEGGMGRFFIGLIMFVTGTYLLLSAIHVNFNLGSRLYYGGYGINSGLLLVPFMLGVGILFFNYRNIFGWLLTFGSLALLIVGVIVNTDFVLRRMDAFELILILVLMVGGLGLFLSSFRSYNQ
ncbi:MAG: hypothetical protein OHK0053_05520 [Microscillaceae bacterium]